MRLCADLDLLPLVPSHEDETSLVRVVAEALGRRYGRDGFGDRTRGLRVPRVLEGELEEASPVRLGDRGEDANGVTVVERCAFGHPPKLLAPPDEGSVDAAAVHDEPASFLTLERACAARVTRSSGSGWSAMSLTSGRRPIVTRLPDSATLNNSEPSGAITTTFAPRLGSRGELSTSEIPLIAYLASMDPRRLHPHTRWATKATHPRREEPCSDSARRRRARLSSFSFSLSRRRRSSSDLVRLPDLIRSPATGHWRALPPAPVAIVAGRTSVWTGTELIVSGVTGAAPDGSLLNSTEVTLAYNPATHAWRRLASPPKTDNYCRRGAVWTGKEMLVWGCGFLAFDPLSNRWRRLSDPPARQGIVVLDRPRDHRLGRRLLRRRRLRRRCLQPGHRHVAQAGSFTSRCRAAAHRGLDRTRARPLRQRSRRCKRQAFVRAVRPGCRLQPDDRYVAAGSRRCRSLATERVSSGPIAKFSSSAAQTHGAFRLRTAWPTIQS